MGNSNEILGMSDLDLGRSIDTTNPKSGEIKVAQMAQVASTIITRDKT